MKQFPGGSGVRFRPIEGAERIEARAADGGGDEGPRKWRVVFSSEAPVTRFGWFGQWREILGHDPGEVQMGRFSSGRASVLEEHRGAPIGVIDGATIDEDRKGRADTRFSRSARAKEVEQDLADEIRSNISVGYIPKRAKLIEEDEEKGDLWRITLWEPVELSVVGVPADVEAQVERSASGGGYPPVEVEGGEPPKEERKMKKVRGDNGALIEVADDDPRPVAREGERSAPSVTDALATRNAETAEIYDTAAANGLMDTDENRARVGEWIKRGLSPAEVAREILNGKRSKAPAQPSSETVEKMSAKDRRGYSYLKAIRMGAAIIAREKGDGSEEFGRYKFEGLEADVHRDLYKALPEGATTKGGILVPIDLRTQEERWQAYSKRTMDSKTVTKGTETVFETPGEFIELLRNAAVVIRRGARVLTGLSGPVGFVKQTGGVSVQWVGENPAADTADSDASLGLVLLQPKTLQGTVPYTRQLLLQSSLDVEAMVREELAIAHGLAIDRAAIHGQGANGEPTGIYKAPGVSVTAMGGAPTYAKLIDMETQVASLNAWLGNLGWITTPTVAGELRKTQEFAGGNSQAIWQGTFYDGIVAGYMASSTNQVSSTMTGSEATGGAEQGVIFGNFSDLLIGLFNTMELIVDPYRLKKRSVIEVTSFQMADVILRHGESFSKSTGTT